MSKMVFDKEQTKNLISMLLSEDVENHVIAFESLKHVDFKKYVGEILVMYKFCKHSIEYWEKQCEVIYNKLQPLVFGKSMTSGSILGLLIANKASKFSIELFMEYFVRDMTKILEDIGYPTDKFEINITLKDE